MRLSLMLPAVLAAAGLLASATEAAKNAELEAPTTSGGLRASTTHQDTRRTNRYWVAPVRNSGLTCIDNSIRAGGGKPNEICMTEGEALCIEYDYKPMGGRWQFGIKDSKLRLYNPKGEIVYEYCKDVTHLCIGEEHGFDPNRYSKERPYLTLYDEKIHEVVGSLTCDGTDGKNDENIGQSSILKLVDQSDVGPYADYPLTLVKFKKGQTEDPKDDNSLWDITVTEPVATATGLQLESFLNYNADRCEWNSYVDSFEDLKRQIAAATDSDPDNRAKIEICEDRPIVFEDIIDFSNKYFEVSCLGDGCVFDLDGYSFVTPDGVGGSAFHAEFEGITVENGSPFRGRNPNVVGDLYGGAFYAIGRSQAESTLVLNECVLRGNRASDSGAIESFRVALNAKDTIFADNQADSFAGAIYSAGGFSEFENCRFEGNSAGDVGGVMYSSDPTFFKNCQFLGNSAGLSAGAIVAFDTSTFEECHFEGNSVNNAGGVAITIGTSMFKNCGFVSNRAEIAGVVGVADTSSFESCHFERNNAVLDGGVVYSLPNSSVSIKSSRFDQNTAQNNGGVAYLEGESSFEDNNFQSNSAGNDGGVIWTELFPSSTIKNCHFDGNNAARDAGAILLGGSVSVTNSRFSGNTATRDSGAIELRRNGRYSFTNTIFEDNAAGETGGAVRQNRQANSSFRECVFQNNRATEGGSFFTLRNAIANFEGSTFGANRASQTGGAIMALDSTTKCQNCEFDSNSAGFDGGAIFLEGGQQPSTFVDCHFNGNGADGGFFNSFGGAILLHIGALASINGCSFRDNFAFVGGAIFAEEAQTYIARNTTFDCNSAFFGGSMVEVLGSIDISNAEFTNNDAVVGGALLIGSVDSSIEDSLFDQNEAFGEGGATAYWDFGGNSTHTINGTIYQNNTSPLLPSDDIYGDNPQDIKCGLNFDNCFCDAEAGSTPNITTNFLPTICSGASIGGSGTLECSHCFASPPSTCSAASRVGAATRAGGMSIENMNDDDMHAMFEEKMNSMGERMEAMKEKMGESMALKEEEKTTPKKKFVDENSAGTTHHHM